MGTANEGSAEVRHVVQRVVAGDGATSEVHRFAPVQQTPGDVVVWLSAMGVAARHYQPLAQELAARGVAVVLHEWRGIGSSDRRAGRHSDWGYRELLDLDLPASVDLARREWPAARVWLGGHSLGGQLATLYSALHPEQVGGLLLVASGAPYWRCFPWRWAVGAAVASAPLLAKVWGHFPGRRLGFGGNEARGVIADWARSGRSGRYVPARIGEDIETRLGAMRLPVLALRLGDDWLAPQRSLDWLLDKMPSAPRRVAVLTADDLDGIRADHFSWMRAPSRVAALLAAFIAE